MTQVMDYEGKPAYIVTGGKPIEFLSDAVAAEIVRLRAINADMLAALRIALNEVHHPGAAAYEQGRDITDILSAAIARAIQEG